MSAAMLWLGEFGLGVPAKKADDCMYVGGIAILEQLPSWHAVNEHFLGGRSVQIQRRHSE